MNPTKLITLDGPANALALNRDYTQVVIAGRSVFKVFTIDDHEFIENCNLRVGKNLNLNFSCNDVAWSSLDDALLATAATNGAVVLWNLNRPTRSKQEHVFNDHKRTVNKVCFHPSDPSLLLSGSQDGTMKCFDLRIKDVVRTFVSNSESVRDVQFCPHGTHHVFTAVSENGSFQTWDLRKGDRYTLEFAAHSGPIFACDYHPELQWIATASRDKTIKVWDLTSIRPTLEYTINTIASIGHVKWRPQRRHHIASCALVVDCNVNVWDVRRPYIPLAAFPQHKDVVTGVAWRGNSDVFLSTSRDCTLVQHSFSSAARPADSANPQAVDISGTGEVALATRVEPPLHISKSEMFLHAKSALNLFERRGAKESEGIIECAKGYVLTGSPLAELCEINEAVARSNGRLHVALVWNVIQTLYRFPLGLEDSMVIRADDLLSEVKGPKVVSSCDASEEKSLRGLDISGQEEDVEIEDFDFPYVPRVPADLQAQGDFFFGDGEADPLSVDQLDQPPRFQIDWTLQSEAFLTRHEILEGAPPEPYAGETIEPPPPAEPATTSVTILSFPNLPILRSRDLVIKALKHHVDCGDVQTAVAILAVMGDRRRELDLPMDTQEHWLLTYIDLLGRYRLFSQAAEIIKIAWIPSVTQLSQQSTTVHTACGACSKPLLRSGWLCDRCRSAPVCSLCHQVVRGLFVWCQGCCHGGHVTHIRAWFRTNKQCPTGCNHTCEFS